MNEAPSTCMRIFLNPQLYLSKLKHLLLHMFFVADLSFSTLESALKIFVFADARRWKPCPGRKVAVWKYPDTCGRGLTSRWREEQFFREYHMAYNGKPTAKAKKAYLISNSII